MSRGSERWVGAGVRATLTVAVATAGLAASAVLLAGFSSWNPWTACVAAVLSVAVAYRMVRHVATPHVRLLEMVALVVIASGAAVGTGLTHSENVLVLRDPSSYYQTAVQLARNHETPVTVDVAAMGGAEVLDSPDLTLTSLAFTVLGEDSDGRIQPQFLTGISALFSLGMWVDPGEGAWWVSPVLFGLAVLLLGLFTSAFVAPGWGSLAAVAAAAAYPLVYSARSTYSEPAALVLLLAAAYLLSEALRLDARDDPLARRAGAVAGVVLASVAFVRLDALRECTFVLVVAAVLQVRRSPVTRGLTLGMSATLLVAVLSWMWQSVSYLVFNKESVIPIAVLFVVTRVAVDLAPRVASRVNLSQRLDRALPSVVAGSVLLIGVVLASRPLWMVSRGPQLAPIVAVQQAEGLPVDATRTYVEHSLEWTAWWMGWPAVAVAFVVAALALARVTRSVLDGDRLPPWSGPLVVGLLSAIATWVRPGVVPDHPWADRRLYIVIPVVIVLATAGIAWVVHRQAARSMVVAGAAALVGGAGLVVPALVATVPTSPPLVGGGTAAAVERACERLRPDDVVLAVDRPSASWWPQVLRGMCAVPVMGLSPEALDDPARAASAVEAATAGVSAAGHRLVLVAATEGALDVAPGGSAELVFDHPTWADDSTLLRRPEGPVRVDPQLWMAPAR